MAQAFIIMQIGDTELDTVCRDVIVPAISACGLEAKRVDKHNSGHLLKSEIIKFISESDIIVADLTNERPNCYLEIGYAMGIDKFNNLILTAREDHFPGSSRYNASGPRIHFDLSGYDILSWEPGKLGEFRSELEKRIKRRQLVIRQVDAPKEGSAEAEVARSVGDVWFLENHVAAVSGMATLHLVGAMEVGVSVSSFSKLHKTPTELNRAAEKAPIHAFGWPIGIYATGNPEHRPRPRTDGVFAEIKTPLTYDYWAINRNTDFYTLSSFVETHTDNTKLFFDIQVLRVTEVLLYCRRLYSLLGYESNSQVSISIRHTGLKDRVLGATNPMRALSLLHRVCGENEIQASKTFNFSQIESNLIGCVKEYCVPLFGLFDFFELSDKVYDELITKFVTDASQ